MGVITDLIKDLPLAPILRERLIDSERQMAALEKENAILEAENAALKEKLQISEAKAKKLEGIINNYENREKISEATKEQFLHSNPPDETEAKILLFLANNGPMDIAQISVALAINNHKVEFHMLEMKEKGMVSSRINFDSDDIWTLDQAGRKYLVENNLIM